MRWNVLIFQVRGEVFLGSCVAKVDFKSVFGFGKPLGNRFDGHFVNAIQIQKKDATEDRGELGDGVFQLTAKFSTFEVLLGSGWVSVMRRESMKCRGSMAFRCFWDSGSAYCVLRSVYIF